MRKPEQRFKVNTRVRLREGVDPIFFNGYGRVGQEGWIRKRKRDRYGFPEVLVEWDKDHWAYNEQPDCWSMEGQFEAVEDSMSESAENPSESREEQVQALAETFVTSILGLLGGEGEQEAPAQEEAEADGPEKWAALATAAAECIQQSPAYVVIALEHVQVEGAPPTIIPRVFHAALKPDYKLIAQSHLAHVLASMQDETIAGVLQQQADDDGKG